MKKALILFIAIHSFTSAQIKVFTGGTTVIGDLNSPSTNGKLTIVGNTTFLSVNNNSIASAPVIRGTNSLSSASLPDYTFWGDAGTGIFHPASNVLALSSNSVEIMRINSSKQILNGNSSYSASAPDYSWNSDANTGIYHPGADVLGFCTGGTERAQLYSNGRFFVGTTPNTGSPWLDGQVTIRNPNVNEACLVVNHNTNANGNSAVVAFADRSGSYMFNVVLSGSSTFNVTGAGDVYGKTWTGWSDRNLKENIDDIKTPLDKLLKLKGVTYNFKAPFDDGSRQTEMGLIAQDVEKIIPEAVKTSDKGIKGIKYFNLIALLIEGVKEQNKTIEKLNLEVSDLKSRIAAVNVPGNGVNSNSKLYQNIPNPFDDKTNINYLIDKNSQKATIYIYNLQGEQLKAVDISTKGEGSIEISARELKPGLYIYSLIVDNTMVDTKRMVLTK